MDYILVALSLPDKSKPVFLIMFGCCCYCCCCSRWWKVLFSSSPNGRVCVQKPAQSPRLKLVWFWSTRFKIISANPLNHDCFQLTIENWNTKVSILNLHLQITHWNFFQEVKCAVLLHNTKELMRKLIFSSGRLMNVCLEVVILTQNNTFGSKKDRLLEYRQRKQLHHDRKSKIFQIWLASCYNIIKSGWNWQMFSFKWLALNMILTYIF